MQIFIIYVFIYGFFQQIQTKKVIDYLTYHHRCEKGQQLSFTFT